MSWLIKDEKYLWHPFTSLQEKKMPLLVKKAKDCTIYLENGDELIDAVSSWWTNIHGHGNEELVKVLTDQAQNLDHVIFAGFTHKPAISLAENLLRITGYSFSKVFLSDDGSTAVEVGLKIALQYWSNIGQTNKTKVLALEGGYHGDTFGAMSLAGKSDFFKAFNDKFFEVNSLPFPTEESIDEIEALIIKLNESETVACIIIEPLLQGSAGMRMYSKYLLNRIFEVCKKQNILIVADEVLTGFGRTGELFASLHQTVKPDIIALSKGITGGLLPFGATLINQKVVAAFDSNDKLKTFFHGHSYTGNAICCAVALKSLELLERNACTENRQRIHLAHLNAQNHIRKHAKVKDCRVLGTVLAVEIENGESSSYFNNIRDLLYDGAIAKKVLLRPLGNVIYTIPPYIITNEELDVIYKVIAEILDEI